MVRIPFKSGSIALGQVDAADPVRTIQLYDAGKDPGRDATMARYILPLNHWKSGFGDKPDDDVPVGWAIELERFLLEVHIAVGN